MRMRGFQLDFLSKDESVQKGLALRELTFFVRREMKKDSQTRNWVILRAKLTFVIYLV